MIADYTSTARVHNSGVYDEIGLISRCHSVNVTNQRRNINYQELILKWHKKLKYPENDVNRAHPRCFDDDKYTVDKIDKERNYIECLASEY